MASSAVNVKKEPGLDERTDPDPEEMQERIVELCKNHPEDTDIEKIKAEVPSATTAQIVKALNALLRAERIKVFKKKLQGKDALVYRIADASSTSGAVGGADVDEKIVLQAIASAGNKGIWARDIRKKTNLAVQQLNKLLKTMLSKKLVKEIKCVNASKKKVYMLFDTVPDSSVTGGAWYNDTMFDQEFANVLNERCHRFLEGKAARAKEVAGEDEPYARYTAGLCTAKEVTEYIQDLKITTVQLEEKDIEAVLDTLIWDGKVREVTRASATPGKGHEKVYHVQHSMIKSPPGVMGVPCGHCPLIRECRADGPISPKNCTYFKEWLDW